MTWSEYLRMGGYGVYVWGAYALMLAAMGTEIVLLLRRRKALGDGRGSKAPRQDARGGR